MAMPPTQRLSRRPANNTPEALAARLPHELRSFDAWHDHPDGMRGYFAALREHVDPHDPQPVMNAAGLSAADWLRHRMTRPTTPETV